MTDEDQILLLPYEKPPGPSRAELSQMLASFAAQGGRVTKLETGDSVYFPKRRKRRATRPSFIRR